jgi:hypothetical protein
LNEIAKNENFITFAFFVIVLHFDTVMHTTVITENTSHPHVADIAALVTFAS